MNDASSGRGGSADSDESPALLPTSRLTLHRLSVTADDGEFLVGDARSGVFVAVPDIGVIALRRLEAGDTIEEAAAFAAQHAGREVDVLDFAASLIEVGFVAEVDGTPLPTAKSRQKGWIAVVPPRLVRPLFSPIAWALYAVLFAFSVGVLLFVPHFRPAFEDVYIHPNIAVSVVLMVVTSIVLTGAHESFHWLAARSLDLPARFRVTLRLFFVVFETDLSQLWALPRRRRFGPLLAGMALDSVVLGASLIMLVAWSRGHIDDLPPSLARFLKMVVLFEVIALGWQAVFFLRTDLYAVLVTALGCRNLSRINYLFLKRKLVRLNRLEQDELASAHARDLLVARWFSLLYIAGFSCAAWLFVTFFVPNTVILAGWVFLSLRDAPVATSEFWQAVAFGTLASLQALVPLVIFVRERLASRSPGSP
jgi:putative peptide zinc metalloprotease protein